MWETIINLVGLAVFGCVAFFAGIWKERRKARASRVDARRRWKTEVLSAGRAFKQVADLLEPAWASHAFLGRSLQAAAARLEALRPDLALVADADLEGDLDELCAACRAWGDTLSETGRLMDTEATPENAKRSCGDAAELAKKLAERLG